MARRTVVNPISGNRIPVDSDMYHYLTRSGFLVDNGDDELQFVVPLGANLELLSFWSPSRASIVQRHRYFPINTYAMRDAVNAWIAGGNWALVAPYIPDAFYRELGAVWRIGYIEVTRNVDDAHGPPLTVRNTRATAALEFMRNLINRSDEPLRLPIKNLILNPGGDKGQCLAQFLGVGEVNPPTLGQCIDLANTLNIPCVIYDIFGKVVLKSRHSLTTRRHVRRGVTAGGHMYILDPNTKRVELIREPVTPLAHVLGDELDVHRWLSSQNCALWREGNAYLTHYGMFVDGVVMKGWMETLLTHTPRSAGFDLRVLESLRSTTCHLNMQSPMLSWYHDNENLVTIDMNKCYYRVFAAMVEHECPFVTWYPTVFAQWRPLTDDCIRSNWFYAIRGREKDLRAFGLYSGVLPGMTLHLLNDVWNLDLQPYAFLALDTMAKAYPLQVTSTVSELAGDQDAMREFQIMNGIFGRVDSTIHKLICLGKLDDHERMWYETRHGISVRGDVLMQNEQRISVLNHYHIYLSVVHQANYWVIQKIAEIYQTFKGAMPVRIKTDSLTYRATEVLGQEVSFDVVRTDICPFTRRFICDWKYEELPDVLPPHHSYRWADPCTVLNELRAPRNQAFLGEPGTGKTYMAMGCTGAMCPPDYALAYTNRGKIRLQQLAQQNGFYDVKCSTIHSFARAYNDAGISNHKVIRSLIKQIPRGSIILVDEYQSIPSMFWSLFQAIWSECEAYFRFCGDEDQVSAIERTCNRVSYVPFMGERIVLTHDWRNEPLVVELRNSILRGTGFPPFTDRLFVSVTAKLRRINLAFRVPTCKYVNERYVTEHHLQWGDQGTLIAVLMTRHPNYINGEVLIRGQCDTLIRPTGHAFRATQAQLDALRQQEVLDWGYCTTVHKSVGETIVGPYTLWDVDATAVKNDEYPEYRRIMYTGVTRTEKLDQLEFRGPPPGVDVVFSVQAIH